MKILDQKNDEIVQKVEAPGCYNENSFYEMFVKDLKNAQSLVVIQSPFIGERRLRNLEPHLRDCIARRVRVCVFIQEPSVRLGDPDSEARYHKVQSLIELLRSWGVHVSLRRSIHAKIVVIDELIFWEGSLNPLSHADSSERMLRWCDRKIVLDAILMHQLDSCDNCCEQSRALKCVPSKITDLHQRKAIGAMIEKRRKELGLTQSALAELSGTNQASVSLLGSGKRPVPLGVLCKVGAQLQLEIRMVPWFYLPALDELMNQGSDAGPEV